MLNFESCSLWMCYTFTILILVGMTEYRLHDDSVFALIYCSCYLLVTHTFASHEFLNECHKCVCISVRVRVCVHARACVCFCIISRKEIIDIGTDYRRYFTNIVSISYRFRNCDIDPALLQVLQHNISQI
jgi:hypothetical protein